LGVRAHSLIWKSHISQLRAPPATKGGGGGDNSPRQVPPSGTFDPSIVPRSLPRSCLSSPGEIPAPGRSRAALGRLHRAGTVLCAQSRGAAGREGFRCPIAWGGAATEHLPPSPSPANPPALESVLRDRIIQDRKYSVPEPPLGRGGEGGGVGGGGSREDDARNPPPGNGSARPPSQASLTLGDRWRRAERGPGPARRGEGRVRRPPPRPTPSRGGRAPRGPAGAGRGGAWERPAGGGGGLGSSSERRGSVRRVRGAPS
jgi:hypothetical protein